MKPEEMTDTAIDYIYENVELSRLTEWEAHFIESTQDQWERHRKLSERQKEILGGIWEKQP